MNIYEAIGSIMKKGVAIGKEKENSQQKFKYRGIDDVMNTFSPLLAEAGIFLVPEVLEAKREERTTKMGSNLIYSVLKVKYTFYAEDGSNVSATVIGEGMDSGDKASNKAMAIAMKYAMFQVFCIPTEEMQDPDAETPPESKPVPVPVPKPAPQQKAQQHANTAPKRQAPPPPDIVPAPGESADGQYICDLCRQPIRGVRKSNGELWTPEMISHWSIAEFDGKQLCADCAKRELDNGR